MAPKSTEKLSHDAMVQRLRGAVGAVSLRAAAEGFVASLVEGPLRVRSTLGHLAFASNLPEHPFTPNRGSQSYMCAICGASRETELDRDALEERLARNATAMADLAAALVDLEGFAKLPPAKATAADLACFDAMLAVIAELPPEGRAATLLEKFRVPKSNRYDRGSLVETLGACGVFDTHDHVGHLTRWIGFWEYEEVPSLSGDMRPPEAWWRRSSGVSREALDTVFPMEGVDRARFPARPIAPRPIEKASIVVPRKGPQPALKLDAGDVVAFGFQDRWVAGVVLGAHRGAKRLHPIIEFHEEVFAELPDSRALQNGSPRLVGPYREAPHARREPLALEGMEFLGGVMGVMVERIAVDHPAIRSNVAVSPYRVVATRNLLYLMATLGSPPPNLGA